MRQAIRALGWAIIILWAVTLLLPIMIGFSLLKLSESNAVGFGEPTVSFSNGAFCLSAPFHINNTGYCDLSDMNVTILVGGNNKTILTFSQSLLNVSAGTTLNSSYNISFSLEEIISKSIELLTDDTDLNLSISTFFRMAHIIGLGLSANMTASWGAPFHNLTVSEVSYDFSSQKLSVSANFENHACFTVNGTISLEIYNSRSELIGFTEGYLNVPSDSLFYDLFELTIDPLEMTESGIICIYFENMQIMEKEWGLSE